MRLDQVHTTLLQPHLHDGLAYLGYQVNVCDYVHECIILNLNFDECVHQCVISTEKIMRTLVSWEM